MAISHSYVKLPEDISHFRQTYTNIYIYIYISLIECMPDFLCQIDPDRMLLVDMCQTQ